MAEEKKKISAKEFLENIFEASQEALEADQDALKQSLREDGIDPEVLVKKAINFIKEFERKQRLAFAKQIRERVLSLIRKYTSPQNILKKENFISELQRILPLPEEKAFVKAYFSKLESTDERDLVGLINDIEILKLLDQMENNDMNE